MRANTQFGGAHASRVLAMVSRHRELSFRHATNPRSRFKKSLFRRDAETNARDACAPQKSILGNSGKSNCRWRVSCEALHKN